ncbi:MAG: H+/Na+-translocating ferredoxin:NAD+ oxidoreductase subunit [Bacillota bacterium]|jgi:electron transport complex protein RnfD|nr:H+/Na+-translocating ferredoxin:NAD+ oxidoreductase subunit [Bacillota bacterium]MDK2881816.1 H+/Na+-translocating ferredoxin:NAD+ oxidoreductase subunit [Bacillota bacterium]
MEEKKAVPSFDKLIVASSPHIRAAETVDRLMWQVIIALIPAAAVSVYFFGIRSLVLMLVGVASAVLTEALVQKALKKEITIADGSAALTGLLLAFNVPANAPWWMVAVGAAFAIAVVKQTFGGLGANFVNPALAARAFMLAAWPQHMTGRFPVPLDSITAATPLAILKGTATGTLPSYLDLFIGNVGGVLGETSALALLVGGAYLIWQKVIDWRTPAGFIGTVALLTWIFGGKGGLFTGDPLYHVLAGGLILGAFFMATDYVTSPITPKGRLIFGIGCGFITVLIRLWGGYPEGVSYSILLMNLVVPFLDRWTLPRVYGVTRARA